MARFICSARHRSVVLKLILLPAESINQLKDEEQTFTFYVRFNFSLVGQLCVAADHLNQFQLGEQGHKDENKFRK